MNSRPASKTSLAIYLVAILGAFLIMAGLVSVMRYYNRSAPVDSKRADERRKASVELRQATVEQLNSYGYVDAAKGVVRLPVERGMEIVINEWKNPAAGRSNLIARFKNANPPPPPKAPEKPSQFE